MSYSHPFGEPIKVITKKPKVKAKTDLKAQPIKKKHRASQRVTQGNYNEFFG